MLDTLDIINSRHHLVEDNDISSDQRELPIANLLNKTLYQHVS